MIRFRHRFGYRLFNFLTVARLALRGELGAKRVRAVAFALSGGAIPLFAGGGPEPTFTTTAAITAGRLAMVTGDRSIGPAAGSSLKVLGVAKQTSDAVGDKLSVSTSGVWMLTAQGAIAAGDQVVAGAAGTGTVSTLAAAAGATAADINNARAVVGRALSAAIDGAQVPVLLNLS